jgi:hypothetical protein
MAHTRDSNRSKILLEVFCSAISFWFEDLLSTAAAVAGDAAPIFVTIVRVFVLSLPSSHVINHKSHTSYSVGSIILSH